MAIWTMISPEAKSGVLKREDDNLVASPAMLSYTEITPDNLDSFLELRDAIVRNP